MRLNKNTKIGFINEGIYNVFKCMYSHKYFDIVPVYISKDIKDIKVIKTVDESYMIIVGADIYNKCKGKVPDVLIAHSLMTVYFNDESFRDELVDVYCAKWFGYNQVISIINNLSLGNDRVTQLKARLSRPDTFKVPDIIELLKTIKCVEIT